ncbi:hypothetical protein H6P81_007994 [Aristolochia fimbriata]|uniref:RING-type domain-containing protein n=1 Tax=Aristolochia fimbriata TaxID=158543 RepID=A0AAV7F1S3_ARIFI|nr:hypothetical protein H6P81_007994 [Aristolochia fimbriata]
MQRGGRWKSLKERLGMGSCCGSLWGFGGEMRMPVREDSSDGEREEEEEEEEEGTTGGAQTAEAEEDCLQRNGTGMNLAMALAAERHFRAAAAQQRQQPEEAEEGEACVTPLRVSLMRLLEEGEDAAAAAEEAEEKEERCEREKGNSLCCVCMGRRKGSAFIPCGHTFCRVCSRELWLNRGSCPLCNRSIIDVLDIF